MPRPKRDNQSNPEDDSNMLEGTGNTEPETAMSETDRQDALAEMRSLLEQRNAQIAEMKAALKKAEQDIAAKTVDVGQPMMELPPDEQGYTYFEITFHPKRSDADEEYPTAAVNGPFMMWPRGKKTVIRSDYKEVIDNAFTPKFKQLPGEERKTIGGLKPFTYTVHRPITRDEYYKLKEKGDREMKASLQQGNPV